MKFHKKQDDELTPTCESKTGMYAWGKPVEMVGMKFHNDGTKQG